MIVLWSHPYSCLACDLLHDSERVVFLSERVETGSGWGWAQRSCDPLQVGEEWSGSETD